MSRLKNIFRFGRLKGHGSRGLVQTEGLDGEIHSSLKHPQSFGTESKAPVGSETYTFYQDGNQDNGAVLIVAGQAPITLDEGDTVIYSSGGATVHCTGAKIELNGSAFGGLIKIDTLTTQLNALVSSFNTHTHPGVAGPPVAPAATFTASTYENGDVEHG